MTLRQFGEPTRYAGSFAILVKLLLCARRCVDNNSLNLDDYSANQNEPISLGAAADMLNVSRATVASARAVREHATPALIEKVERGQVSVSAAYDVARLPEPQQREIVAKSELEILKAAKEIRTQRAEERRAANDVLKANLVAVPTEGKYGTIVIDPPWAGLANCLSQTSQVCQ